MLDANPLGAAAHVEGDNVTAPSEATFVDENARRYFDQPKKAERQGRVGATQPDERSVKRQHRPWIVLLRLDVQGLPVGIEGQPRFSRGKTGLRLRGPWHGRANRV